MPPRLWGWHLRCMGLAVYALAQTPEQAGPTMDTSSLPPEFRVFSSSSEVNVGDEKTTATEKTQSALIAKKSRIGAGHDSGQEITMGTSKRTQSALITSNRESYISGEKAKKQMPLANPELIKLTEATRRKLSKLNSQLEQERADFYEGNFL